ncbi:GSCOCG00007083001-RA-CDS [Cotesia congregata]|nr:GSCOCG00007083001-RA-CDS [Cotesia congregata]
MSDTRPIANLSHLAKVFERIVANQLVSYLETNSLLDEHQSGFRKHHSTQAALLSLTDDIRKAIDNDDLTYLILFDFTKAFDYVNPKVLYI